MFVSLASKLLALLENRYKGGGVGLGLPGGGVHSLVRKSSRVGQLSDGSSDKDVDGSNGNSSSTNEEEKKNSSSNTIETRRKGNRFSQLSHKFRDLVNDRFIKRSSETSNESSTKVPSSASSTSGNHINSSPSSSNMSHIGGGGGGGVDLDSSDLAKQSPLAGLRDRDKMISGDSSNSLERDRDQKDVWKPNTRTNLLSPGRAERASDEKDYMHSSGSTIPPSSSSSSHHAHDDSLSTLKLQLNGSSVDFNKFQSISPSSSMKYGGGGSSSSSTTTGAGSIADSLASAAAAAAASISSADSIGSPSHPPPLTRGFTSPGSLHRSSLIRDRGDSTPLFLRKSSIGRSTPGGGGVGDMIVDGTRERSSSNASPTIPSASESHNKWNQELAQLRHDHNIESEQQFGDTHCTGHAHTHTYAC